MSILSVLGASLKIDISNALTDFAADEVGALAVAAVEWAEAEMDGGGAAKLEAATTNLLNAAEALGKDLLAEGEKDVNALLELGLQFVTAKAAGLIVAAL
jgi:hypothetical protein